MIMVRTETLPSFCMCEEKDEHHAQAVEDTAVHLSKEPWRSSQGNIEQNWKHNARLGAEHQGACRRSSCRRRILNTGLPCKRALRLLEHA